MGPIYLDWNATAPLLPAAWEAMQSASLEAFGNPSSAHSFGRKSRQLLEDSRERVASLMGAATDEVIFTSGATEANNLALFGLAGQGGHLAATVIEHPCVAEPFGQLEKRGFTVGWIPVNREGVVGADEAAALVDGDTGLVSVMLVNHETGAIQPIRELARSLPVGVRFHVDAAQAVGRMPVNFHDLGATALTASAHKFRGPKGIGMLLLKRGTRFEASLFGGHQQHGRRPGTEPVALACGMAAALDHAVRHMHANLERLTALRARLWERLSLLAPSAVLNGPPIGSGQCLPSTLNVSFPKCRGDLLLIALDLVGVACSAGAACSSGSLLPSPVLRAMAVPEEALRSAIRFSFGPELTMDMIDVAAGRIAEAVRMVLT